MDRKQDPLFSIVPVSFPAQYKEVNTRMVFFVPRSADTAIKFYHTLHALSASDEIHNAQTNYSEYLIIFISEYAVLKSTAQHYENCRALVRSQPVQTGRLLSS